MKGMRPLVLGLAFASGCATAPVAQLHLEEHARADVEARCRLVGSLSGRPGHQAATPVLDERKTMGPAQVIWAGIPRASLVTTQEGLLYQCDRTL
jgi:hypothetical protein